MRAGPSNEARDDLWMFLHSRRATRGLRPKQQYGAQKGGRSRLGWLVGKDQQVYGRFWKRNISASFKK